MTITGIKIEPGEITVILAEDMNTLTRHAAHTAKRFAETGASTLLLNCGMMNRRFWKVARDEAGALFDEVPHKRRLFARSMTAGNLFHDRVIIRQLREACKSKVLIINGWEWASKSWRLKEDLIFHLREIAEAENIAIIVYSQARTNPVPGRWDRGGIGRLASIALSIARIEEEEADDKTRQKPVTISPEDEVAAEEFAMLVTKEINELGGARAPETLPQRNDGHEVHKEEEVEEEELEFA